MSGVIACDIIIPVYNKPDLTRNCLESIVGRTQSPYRIILIDNASDAATKSFLEAFRSGNANVTLITNTGNVGWVRAVNQGLKASTAPYVCIMNNDTIVETDGWLGKLIAAAESEKDIGLVNPNFDEKGTHASGGPYIEIDFCRGYCVLVKRQVIDRIGMLDEAYGMGYYDDDDYSVRAIRAGFRCVKVDDVVVRHLKDTTFTSVYGDRRMSLHEANKKLFYAKWGRRLRIVFIVTKHGERKAVEEMLLWLARRQHIVYLWNATKPFAIRHINIRERVYAPRFSKLVFSAKLMANSMKKKDKRYILVFVDDARSMPFGASGVAAVHHYDVRRDERAIRDIVDSAAKV